jgi:aryl-alcohol dehydrogenase-like predicted oxidoreductase
VAVARLGRTDIEISPIGLGCWQFSSGVGIGSYWSEPVAQDVQAIVQASLDGGIDWFDTAEAYGSGRSERALAAALQACGKAPGDVVIATKWRPFLRIPSSIERTIDTRIACLAPFPIDLHQVHAPVGTFGTERQKAEYLARIVKAGKVRAVGVSNYPGKTMAEAHALLAEHGVPLTSNQVHYNLLHRRAERSVIPKAKALGITVIAYSPLGQGRLTGKFHDDPSLVTGPRRWRPEFSRRGLEKSRPVIDEVRRIADARGVTPSQVALRWTIQFHGDTVVAIPGASKVSHAQQNVGALTFELTADELRRLDEVSQPFC